jgi:hypothetical protein
MEKGSLLNYADSPGSGVPVKSNKHTQGTFNDVVDAAARRLSPCAVSFHNSCGRAIEFSSR